MLRSRCACLCLMLFLAAAVLPASAEDKPENPAPGRLAARQAVQEREHWVTVDHSTLEALNKEFKSGEEVTAACLSCHTRAGEQFKQTIHWTWIDPASKGSETLMGKAGHSVNNFCISANAMKDKSCLDCHTGWKGEAKEVNCLACHGQIKLNWTESFDDYNAFAEAGDEDSKELAAEIQGNIQKAVRSIGLPGRNNCGACHFYGGGGDGVKHGDLDSSMTQPNKALDVHMAAEGRNFTCTRCHTTQAHRIAGRIYATPASTERKSLVQDDLTAKITCESCHTAKPHQPGSKANDHTDKVACQSCHIPEFARVNPTKMSWDWSRAGKTKDGRPYKEKGEFGKEIYLSIKGEMKWAKNVKPEYQWFNGSIRGLTVKDVIDPGSVVKVSWPQGSQEDPNSRIFPFKVHQGKQPYDKIRKTLLAPMLSGKDGYWTTLDWQHANRVGSEALNVPYSGEYDFVETAYVFPTTHMVAPKENAVSCSECHVREQGRLANLAGFYMPGRDVNPLLDWMGWLLVLGSLAGVMLHGLGRIFTRKAKEK